MIAGEDILHPSKDHNDEFNTLATMVSVVQALQKAGLTAPAAAKEPARAMVMRLETNVFCKSTGEDICSCTS